MNSDSLMVLFDVVILAYGLSMIYNAYKMKQTHQPPSMIINQADLIGARDVRGFCEAMFKPLVLFGALAVLYGIVGMVNDMYVEMPMVNFVSVALFLILCFWFLREIKKAKAKYLK